eukprot:512539-Prorocentrum_minimum.AAC.1
MGTLNVVRMASTGNAPFEPLLYACSLCNAQSMPIRNRDRSPLPYSGSTRTCDARKELVGELN